MMEYFKVDFSRDIITFGMCLKYDFRHIMNLLITYEKLVKGNNTLRDFNKSIKLYSLLSTYGTIVHFKGNITI